MKIRTDFVTNSSSSSFTIMVTVKDTSGKEYSFTAPNDDPDEIFRCSLDCKAEEILKAKSVSELIDLLRKSLVNGEDDCDSEYYEEVKKACWGEFESFAQKLHDDGDNIERIESFVLDGHWKAWGEASSCFLSWDSPFDTSCFDDAFDSEKNSFVTLGSSEGEEEDDIQLEFKHLIGLAAEGNPEALARLEKIEVFDVSIYGGWNVCYLKNDGDATDRWPTGILGQKPGVKFIVRNADYAKAFYGYDHEGDYSCDDGHEYVIIDFKKKTIEAHATYEAT